MEGAKLRYAVHWAKCFRQVGASTGLGAINIFSGYYIELWIEGVFCYSISLIWPPWIWYKGGGLKKIL